MDERFEDMALPAQLPLRSRPFASNMSDHAPPPGCILPFSPGSSLSRLARRLHVKLLCRWDDIWEDILLDELDERFEVFTLLATSRPSSET